MNLEVKGIFKLKSEWEHREVSNLVLVFVKFRQCFAPILTEKMGSEMII